MVGPRAQCRFERCSWTDFGQAGAPRLLAGFASQADPALAPFGGGGEKRGFGAGGIHRQNSFHAQFGGLFDDPFKTIELDERGAERDVDGRGCRLDWFDHPEKQPIALNLLDARQPRLMIIGDFVKLSLLGAKDTDEVAGILATQLGGIGINVIDEKSAAGQLTIVDRRKPSTIPVMIALLRGVLIEKHPNQAIVETGGVGYDVSIPVSTFTHLPDAGAEVRLRIHTHVREDALSLYGFLTQDEKALFEKLIGVSGIGPTLAVKILSGLAAPDLIASIRRGEVERLVRIPGIGKKTAERMVLELRDKLPAPAGEETSAAAPRETLSPVEQDVLSALLNLGCARPQAEAAVRKAKAGAPTGPAGAAEFEPLFRRALEMVR